jgi:hypothetical protein
VIYAGNEIIHAERDAHDKYNSANEVGHGRLHGTISFHDTTRDTM